MKYLISEIAEIIGVPSSTIRYYDKKGLLPNIKRESGKRVFFDEDVKWLKILNCLKNTGMPLKEIREYIKLVEKGDNSLKERYNIILNQKQCIKEQIKILKQSLKELSYKEWYYKTAIEAGTESIHKNSKCNSVMVSNQIQK